MLSTYFSVRKNRICRHLFLLTMLALIVSSFYVVMAQEGRSIAELLRRANSVFGMTPAVYMSHSGQRYTRQSRQRVYRKKQSRGRRRHAHRRKVDLVRPPRVRKSAGLTIKVLDRKGKPVPNITLAAVIHSKGAADIKTTRVTNENGHLVLNKVGPLPAAVALYSDSPRWKIADVESSSYEVEPSAAAMHYGIAKVRPAVLKLRVRGGGGAKLSTAALTRSIENEDADEIETREYRDEVSSTDPEIAEISDDQEIELPSDNLGDVFEDNGRLAPRIVPIVLSKNLPGGKAESIISDYDEGAEEDTVTPAEPRLASVNSVMITGGIGVLSSDDEIEKLGKDWKKPKDQGLLINEEDGLTDGSEWWIYPKHGLAVKERSWLKKDDHLTERIRLLTVQAGEISGIRVGSSVSELRERLGAPQVVNAQPLPSDRFATDMMQAVTTSSKEDKKKEKSKKDKNNSPETLVPETAVVQNVDAVPSGIPNSPQIDSYLDDGLRFCHDGVKVLWIDVARPTELLKTGTTSFVQPNRTRVYVESFTGYNGAVQLNMHNEASFKNYLRRLPSIELVNSRDDADLVIKARVTNFTQDKDQLFGSLIPYDYSCQTTLEYDLIDVATGKYIARDEKITGESKASFRKDIYIAITGGIVFSKLLGGDTGTPVVFLVAAGTIYHLKRQMQKAANRCPGISERQVFDRLTQDVNNAVDYKAQITAIDYAKGWLTLNVGSEDGISASATQRPFEFEVALGDAPLLDKSEDGRKADYYSAVVREVSAHSCVCELRHVEGGVKSSGYEIPSTPAPEIVKQLPDPTTGVLTARAWTRFAPVTVISDADIRRSDEYEEQKRKEREAQQKAAEEQARQNKK